MMKTSEIEERRGQNIQFIKTVIAMSIGILSVIFFFLPYIQIIVNNTMYNLSGFQILTLSGILVKTEAQEAVIAMPILMKIGVTLGAAFALVGALLIFMKKATPAAIAFIIATISPFLSLISVSELKSSILNLNISSNRLEITFLWTFIFLLFGGLIAAISSLWTKGGESLAKSVFFAFSCVSIGSVLFIMLYMITTGAPAIGEIGVFKFLFGTQWNGSKEQFGILPMILSSICGTFGAILIGVPIGLLTAVFLAEISKRRTANFIRPAIELLAGIPSVVYGFFGMLVIVPFLRNIFSGMTTADGKPVVGDSLLAVILVLSIMILPTIVSTAETAMRSVPKSYREASLGLGATQVQTIFKVTIPAAKSGILSGVILGVGRAIGETMAVIMVAGNIANMPDLLGSVRLLTTGIAIDMAYSSGLFRQALFGIGLVLFVFIMIVNISFMAVSKRGVKMDGNK